MAEFITALLTLPLRHVSLMLLAAVAVSSQGIYEPGNPALFKAYTMLTPESGPCDITEGSDGLVYIQELQANKIARLNQSNGELTEYNIPFTLPATSSPALPVPGLAKAVLLACGLRTGFDGYLYLTNGLHNQLVRHDVQTGDTVVFTPPGAGSTLGNLQPFNDITTSPQGVFFTQSTANAIGKFDYRTHQFTNYYAPTPASGPGGLFYTNTDNSIYFTEIFANKLARLDPETGNITEYPVPGCGPAAIRAETTDQSTGESTVWFACMVNSTLGGFNIQRKQFVFIPTLTPEALPIEVAVDYAGHVFVTYAALQKLGVYNTKTGNYSEIGIPGALVNLPAVTSLPFYEGNGIFGNPVQSPTFGHGGIGNAMWFSETTTNKVVRYNLNGFSVP